MSGQKQDLDSWISTQSLLNKLYVHDLRNLITAISANLSYIQSFLPDVDEEMKSAVSDSILAADMMRKFADNLYLISRLEQKEENSMSGIEINYFIQSVLKRNMRFAESAGINLVLDGEIPQITLSTQYNYLEMLVDNLLLSAIRHSPSKGVVKLASSVSGDELKIMISDNGIPVSKEHATDMFTREGQNSAKISNDSRYGRGLGLYGAGLAAKMLKGNLSVSSDEKITRVTFSLKL